MVLLVNTPHYGSRDRHFLFDINTSRLEVDILLRIGILLPRNCAINRINLSYLHLGTIAPNFQGCLPMTFRLLSKLWLQPLNLSSVVVSKAHKGMADVPSSLPKCTQSLWLWFMALTKRQKRCQAGPLCIHCVRCLVEPNGWRRGYPLS